MCYYGQNNEDEFVVNRLNLDKNNPGLLLDVGACNGVSFSNSRWMIEQYNWCGIMVEPCPILFTKLLELYGDNEHITLINAALFPDEPMGLKKFYDDNGMFVATSNEQHVKLWSSEFKFRPYYIQPIYWRHLMNPPDGVPSVKDCDIVLIDVEGANAPLLEAMPKEVKPRIIVIEYSDPVGDSIERLTKEADSRGYIPVHQTPENLIFQAK